MKRRPVYDRYLRRKHHMPLDPPTEAEKRDAILILLDPWRGLVDAIVALWENAEHDHARSGMLLTLRQDLGYDLPSQDDELPSSEELRSALVEDPAYLIEEAERIHQEASR